MVTKPTVDAGGGLCQPGIHPRARGTLHSTLSHQGTSHTGNTRTAPTANQTSHMHCATLLVGEKTACQSSKPCPGLWDTGTGGLDLWQALAVPGLGRDEQHHFWDFQTPSGTANQKVNQENQERHNEHLGQNNWQIRKINSCLNPCLGVYFIFALQHENYLCMIAFSPCSLTRHLQNQSASH